MNRQFYRANHSFTQLQSILSKMKVAKKDRYPKDLAKYGNSNMFSYATSRQHDKADLKSPHLPVWSELSNMDTKHLTRRVLSNGFEEMILLTDEGKLWRYPIDNESGLEEEKDVSFEDHIFLDKHLEDFPKNESLRSYMQLVILGLSNNPYMTAERKKNVIKFYKGYFESKRDTYKQLGVDIE